MNVYDFIYLLHTQHHSPPTLSASTCIKARSLLRCGSLEPDPVVLYIHNGDRNSGHEIAAPAKYTETSPQESENVDQARKWNIGILCKLQCLDDWKICWQLHVSFFPPSGKTLRLLCVSECILLGSGYFY